MPLSPASTDSQQNVDSRHVPILPSTGRLPGPDAMEVSPPPPTMGPPIHSSPETEHTPQPNGGPFQETALNNQHIATNGLSAAAATSSQQPKVVQTAFIHKLYNMLEDSNIQHLISWSNNNESFVMSPSTDFSKVLSQYFKHTNISSFVRQLNMYGFHKVSDVFHTGSPDSTLWEFKHGNGNFKRGDLAGLREIKRRASRHALIHRDSFTSPHRPSITHPNTPTEPVVAEVAGDARIANLEYMMHEVTARLVRSEENNNALSSKCQSLSESLHRSVQWIHDLTQAVTTTIPDPESSLRRDVVMMQKEISRRLDVLRSPDDPHDALLSGRQTCFSNMALDSTPLSPRQPPEERRSSLHAVPPPRANANRPPVPPIPSHFNSSPRRYGSIGTAQPTPNYHRAITPHGPGHPPIPPPPPAQHPLAHALSPPGPNLGRRHTSADIRVPGWPGHGQNAPPGGLGSPFASAESSSQWPSSPSQVSNPADQHIRESLASYEFGAPRKQSAAFSSNQTTPPLTSDTTTSTLSVESGWSLGGSRFPGARHLDTSGPPTRRSSMASNVHSLLNPAETVERDEEEAMADDRKRKRVI